MTPHLGPLIPYQLCQINHLFYLFLEHYLLDTKNKKCCKSQEEGGCCDLILCITADCYKYGIHTVELKLTDIQQHNSAVALSSGRNWVDSNVTHALKENPLADYYMASITDCCLYCGISTCNHGHYHQKLLLLSHQRDQWIHLHGHHFSVTMPALSFNAKEGDHWLSFFIPSEGDCAFAILLPCCTVRGLKTRRLQNCKALKSYRRKNNCQGGNVSRLSHLAAFAYCKCQVEAIKRGTVVPPVLNHWNFPFPYRKLLSFVSLIGHWKEEWLSYM